MSGITAETFIPEQCLGVFIASRLIDNLGWCAKREVSYEKMLTQLGYPRDPDLEHDHGQLKADIAIYKNSQPAAIIEIKKAEKPKDVEDVKRDQEKLQKLTKRLPIPSYLALVISDDNRSPVNQQTKRVEQNLDHNVRSGARHKDHRTKKWEWCFGCVTLRPPSAAPAP